MRSHLTFIRFGDGNADADWLQAIYAFRSTLFIEHLGWVLESEDGCERDQFDRADTVYCTLSRGEQIIGCFRANRTDQPCLAEALFPEAATLRPYPNRQDAWEISRFGVLATGDHFGLTRQLYGAMFSFALARSASSLVALADEPHERFLRLIGIRTRRYGPPITIGRNAAGRPITILAGEIALSDQQGARYRNLLASVSDAEIVDASLVLGRKSLSA